MTGSNAELQFQFGLLSHALHLVETEDSWQKIEGALAKLETLTKGGAYKYDAFIPLLKEHAAPIVNSLLSERTKLSGTAADLLTSTAPRLAARFDALVSTFVPPLLQLCARTNKVALVRAKKCLLLIAKHCKLASLLPYLRDGARDKSNTLRNVSVEVVLTLLEAIENTDRIGKRVGDVETIIRSTATDRDPEVRQWCRRIFELYMHRWPARLGDFTAAFTPTTRRYLAFSGPAAAENRNAAGPSTGTASRGEAVQRKPLHRIQPTVAGPSKRSHVEQMEATKAKSTLQSALATSQQATHVVRPLRDAPHKSRAINETMSPRKVSNKRTDMTGSSTRSASGSKQQAGTSSSSITDGSETRRHAESHAIAPPTSTADYEEERERMALRAEITRQSAATPSRGIAARLALEQFEMRMRSKAGGNVASSDEAGAKLDASSTSRAALAAFAVAASKKHSPKRMPARVPLAPPPTEQRPTISTATTSMPQRVAKPATEVASTKKHKTPEPPQSPDVFGSRPMPTMAASRARAAQSSAGKRTSTLSKSMGARGKLLGHPSGAAGVTQKLTAAKAAASKPSTIRAPSPASIKFFAVPTSPIAAEKQAKPCLAPQKKGQSLSPCSVVSPAADLPKLEDSLKALALEPDENVSANVKLERPEPLLLHSSPGICAFSSARSPLEDQAFIGEEGSTMSDQDAAATNDQDEQQQQVSSEPDQVVRHAQSSCQPALPALDLDPSDTLFPALFAESPALTLKANLTQADLSSPHTRPSPTIKTSSVALPFGCAHHPMRSKKI